MKLRGAKFRSRMDRKLCHWRSRYAASSNTEFQPIKERTMNRRADEMIKAELVEEFNAVASEAEKLLKSMANTGGDKANALRARLEQIQVGTKDVSRNFQQAATKRTKAAVHATGEYVHEHPWKAVGIAAGVSVVTGVMTGLLLNRR
jgi:ElaB/YqjD/DUF883 family membrane-anchored ribosome-binding protein